MSGSLAPSPLSARHLDGVPSVGHLLRQRAATHPDRVLLREVDGRTLTLTQTDHLSDDVAHRLRDLGVQPGDRVAITIPNMVEWPVAWFAIAKLGAVAVPVNPRSGPADLEYVLRHSGARAIVAAADDAIAGAAPLPVVSVTASVAPARRAPLTLDAIERDSLLNVQYTSGTTGMPKGVMLTHDYWLRLASAAVDGVALSSADVVLTVQPFYYLDPQWTALMCLAAGAELVIAPRFSASRFWSEIIDHRVTFVYLVGTMPTMLYKQPPDPRLELGHALRGVMCSGIPPAMHARFEERWGVPFREAFGMTETGVDLIVPFTETSSVGTGVVGRPVAGKEVAVFDDGGRRVPDGSPGELVVRGRPRMEGYWNDPHATAAVIRDGWLHTGDLAVRTPDGAFRIVGRLKDMIRRGGENISAVEVEAALCEHPGIKAAAVVAVPDELRGEEVLAFLQPVGARIDERDVVAHVRERLAAFKAPRYIRWVDGFPLTPSERVAKHLLPEGSTDAWDARG